MEDKTIINQKTYNELKELMGADFIAEIVDTFIQETGELIDQLRQALELKDAATFDRCAHSIKSSSASLGALDFSRSARQLEMMGKAGDLSQAESLVEQLAADFLEVKHSLEALKNES
jgi:HPt (histidine-containing phosphotransfer) domain-containing protein